MNYLISTMRKDVRDAILSAQVINDMFEGSQKTATDLAYLHGSVDDFLFNCMKNLSPDDVVFVVRQAWYTYKWPLDTKVMRHWDTFHKYYGTQIVEDIVAEQQEKKPHAKPTPLERAVMEIAEMIETSVASQQEKIEMAQQIINQLGEPDEA